MVYSTLREFAELGSISATTRGLVRRIGVNASQADVKLRGRSGGRILPERDWDNCLILDACRYDMFESSPSFETEHTSRIDSLASGSTEFIARHFAGRNLYDTVYVTSNPHINKFESPIFHDVYDIYQTGWDDDLQTVPPEAMIDAARDAARKYPDKRLLIHFMQPHYPFIGDIGQQLNQKGLTNELVDGSAKGREQYAIWTQLDFGFASVSNSDVWEAYRENLEVVADDALPLMNELEGKSVITADHGNLLGERLRPFPVRAYGHPNFVRSPVLTTVPWYAPPCDSRKEVTSDSPISESKDTIDKDVVDERLSALGYT